jgi:hypothetical protein
LRKAPFALALLFLVAHLVWLPRTFADIDAINFALGVRHFDVAAHQPHPPGYPVFIAAARISTAAARLLGIDVPEVRGLALLSVIAATLAIPALFVLFRALSREDESAFWATLVTAVTPLYWFTALRPLSDLSGLCLVLIAQALLVVVIFRDGPDGRRPWLLLAGAVLSGLAIGVRSQSFTLTLPLLAVALVVPDPAVTVRSRLAALAALVVAGVAWAVPLVVLNGGIDAYLAALGNQAGEDFVGASMLWTDRSARGLLFALQRSFLWPWGGLIVGAVMIACAAAGVVRLVVRQRTRLLILSVAYGPYAVFHLLFQETPMIRYALPLVPPVAFLAVCGIAAAGVRAVRTTAAAFAVVALVTTSPVAHQFGTEASPGAAAITDAIASDAPAIGMHAVMRRHEQWYHDNASGRVVRARHGAEILALVDLWRRSPDATVQFLASPRRSDLAMLDGRSRDLLTGYSWGFPEMPLMGGARPNQIERYAMRPPGWMLDQGWAVTAEVAGESFRAGARPELRPSVAWIRSRIGPATMVIGGRHLGSAGAAPGRLTASLPGGWQTSWEVTPGFFVRIVEFAAGALTGPQQYLPLGVSATPVSDGDIRISLEQFDLQGPGVPMMAFGDGWQEPEYNASTGRAWRWMGPRSEAWVRPVGRDVSLTLRAESPLRYFDRAPVIRVSIGGAAVSELTPDGDFTWQVTLPAAQLAAANGRILIESNESFVPGGGDQRQLAVRVYALRVD